MIFNRILEIDSLKENNLIKKTEKLIDRFVRHNKLVRILKKRKIYI